MMCVPQRVSSVFSSVETQSRGSVGGRTEPLFPAVIEVSPHVACVLCGSSLEKLIIPLECGNEVKCTVCQQAQ